MPDFLPDLVTPLCIVQTVNVLIVTVVSCLTTLLPLFVELLILTTEVLTGKMLKANQIID